MAYFKTTFFDQACLDVSFGLKRAAENDPKCSLDATYMLNKQRLFPYKRGRMIL